jgi:hypothetical protein
MASSGSPRENWSPKAGSVLIMPVGQTLPLVLSSRIHLCQNRRSFGRACEWLAFYFEGRIAHAALIEGVPVDDVIPGSDPELRSLVGPGSAHPNPLEPRTMFRLGPIEDVGPILNDSVSEGGRRIAYCRGQRYTTIEQLRSASRTSELD